MKEGKKRKGNEKIRRELRDLKKVKKKKKRNSLNLGIQILPN